MRHCLHCNQRFDEKETYCPHCTIHNNHNSDTPLNHEEATYSNDERSNAPIPRKNMTPILALAIFFFPIIFAWLTLQKGYSELSKTLALSWLGVFILSMLINLSVVNATHIEHSRLLQQSRYAISPMTTNEGLDENQSQMALK